MIIKRLFIPILAILNIVFSSSLDEDEIEFFYNARYGGDTSSVNQFLSEDFIYEQIPYVGLGIETYFIDESLLITKIVQDTLPKNLKRGDRIHEHNDNKIDSLGLITVGSIGENQKLIVTKAGDSTFQEINIPLREINSFQGLDSFLETIHNYSNRWYEYDITIIESIITKTRAVVHYKWEGSKSPKGRTYFFSAIEILHIDKKTKYIEKLKILWSEKQFRDQFK